MTCPICHHPADQLWHGVPICSPCRNGVANSRPTTKWVLIGCVLAIIVCLITITH